MSSSSGLRASTVIALSSPKATHSKLAALQLLGYLCDLASVPTLRQCPRKVRTAGRQNIRIFKTSKNLARGPNLADDLHSRCESMNPCLKKDC